MAPVLLAMSRGAAVIAPHAQKLMEGDPTPQQTISTAVGTALSTVSTDALGLIATVLPYALSVVGAVIVVTVGIKIFKRITGR